MSCGLRQVVGKAVVIFVPGFSEASVCSAPAEGCCMKCVTGTGLISNV